MQDYGKKEARFSPSNYFFVINWDYRTSYEAEDVVRPYFIDHTNTTNDSGKLDTCPTGLYENSNCIMFNYYLDFDYSAEGFQQI